MVDSVNQLGSMKDSIECSLKCASAVAINCLSEG